jgi:hypothetical protein
VGFNRGPKSATNGLVLYYDTGNVKSYAGEPTTNLVSGNPTFNGVSGTQTNGETTSWVFSGLGPDRNGFAYYNSETSPINLKFPNEGAVITPWRDPQTTYSSNRRIYQYLTISPNTTYTVSHWFYRSHDVGAGCAIFQYSDSFSTYIGGEYLPGYDGVSNAGEWTLYSQTFTSLPNAVSIIIGPVISWVTEALFAMQRFQIEQKSHVTPFVNGTRSTTQGLIDLTNTASISLANVSFDSNSNLTFDGTNDSLEITRRQYTSSEAWTAELIIYPKDGTNGSWNGIFGGDLGVGGYWMFHSNQLTYYEGYWNPVTKIAYTGLGLGSTIPANQYTHLTIIYNGQGHYYVYLNASLATEFDWTHTGSYSLDMRNIGGPAARYGTVDVPLFKMYQTELTSDQVFKNFMSIKSRFNIS